MSAPLWFRPPGLHARSLDPPGQHQAAKMFGKLVAMKLAEADDFLPTLLKAATEAGYTGDPGGLRTRLAWSIADSAAAWEITRVKCDRAIRQAVRALFATWEEPEVIRAAAHHQNATWNSPLCMHEVSRLLREEASRFLRTRGPHHV